MNDKPLLLEGSPPAMTLFRGRVTIAGRTIFPDVAVSLQTVIAPDGGVVQDGLFHLPPGTYLGAGVYGLELNDGRAGKIVVPPHSVGNTLVPFTIVSFLQRDAADPGPC